MSSLVFIMWGAVAVGPDGVRQWATGPGVWRKGYDVEVWIENSPTHSVPLQLTSNVLVPSLWETMVQTSEYDFYYKTTVKIWYHYHHIGTLTIEEHAVGATANGTEADENALLNSVAPNDSALSLAQAAPLNLTTYPSYPTGRIPFPKDNRYSITYTYDTTQIQSKDVFMAVLGILATAAQYDAKTQSVKELKQVSPSERCAITLTPTPGLVALSYANAVVALNVLIHIVMLELGKFAEMGFSVWLLQQEIAHGSIKALSPGLGVAAEEK